MFTTFVLVGVCILRVIIREMVTTISTAIKNSDLPNLCLRRWMFIVAVQFMVSRFAVFGFGSGFKIVHRSFIIYVVYVPLLYMLYTFLYYICCIRSFNVSNVMGSLISCQQSEAKSDSEVRGGVKCLTIMFGYNVL